MTDAVDWTSLAEAFALGRPVARETRPMVVSEVITERGHAGLRVDGDCPDRCRSGFRFETDSGGYERSRECNHCGPITRHARRVNAARLPVWAHQVRRDWRGERTLAQVEQLAQVIRSGDQLARVWYGAPGRGKSWLACATAMACLDLGMTVQWVTWPDLLASLRDQLRDDRPLRPMVEPLLRADLLVVDEVKGMVTPFAADLAESLIGRRCELGGRIICTANLSEPQLWAYLGDRVRSRLAQAGRLQAITGEDMRCTT